MKTFPLSRVAGLVSATLILASVSQAQAQKTPFTDVPSGAYYEDAAASLLSSGALDAEARLRPSNLATRAELVKLLVNLNRTPLASPRLPSFVDVSVGAWYYSYFETAAKMGWVHGDGDCYGQFRPCSARPAAQVNRAEAATLLVRVFGLQRLNLAPQFSDNSSYRWYYDNIQIAADNCVLQGDDFSGNVRPGASMNRAEMVVMFYRATQNMRYGRDCGATAPHITGVSVQSASRIRVSFNDDLALTSAQSRTHYAVRRVSDGHIVAIASASLLSSRTVELALSTDLDSATDYTVSVDGLVSTHGMSFSDSSSFTSLTLSAHLVDAVALSATRVRLHFDADLDRHRAQDRSLYSVVRVSGDSSVAVSSATFVDSRTVDLNLSASLAVDTSYRVTANHLLTSSAQDFSGGATFTLFQTQGRILDVTAVSPIILDIAFNADLDSARAQETTRYSVSDGNSALPVRTARLLSDGRTVELTLYGSMQTQAAYTVSVTDMLTSANVLFSGTHSVIMNNGSVSFTAVLSAVSETPSLPFTVKGGGTGTFVLQSDGLHYDIVVQNLSGSVTAAHFHRAAAGVAGPVVQSITFNGNHSSGVWALSESNRNALLAGEIYVNVHTAAHPDGEIRGQLNRH